MIDIYIVRPDDTPGDIAMRKTMHDIVIDDATIDFDKLSHIPTADLMAALNRYRIYTAWLLREELNKEANKDA